jgi:DNA-binding NtrC family response regulator
MSPRIQAKLLRCLESGEFRPLGGTENRYTDARIIAAGQPERLENPHNVRPDLKSRLCQLSVEILPLRELEKRHAGTIYKIAFILMERYTWTRMFRDNSSLLLTPADIKRYQEDLFEDANISRISQQEWRESNIRELNNFLRQWIVFGDVELDRLTGPPAGANSSGSTAEPLPIYDEVLKSLLHDPLNRAELKSLLDKKPLRNLKEAYIRHLYTIYSRIIDAENMTADMPKKATQKELARLMGVTENTISRHLH